MYPFVCPFLPCRQVHIAFLAQWSLVGPGILVLDPFTGWGRWRLRDAGTRGLLAPGSSRAPDSLGTERRPAAGWGDLGGCRCPFPVEGQRARVARGGKERRPFRRVTAAESRWLTHPGRPSLPGPERPGPGLPQEREMPPAVPGSRNWGHWATGPAALGQGHRCLDLPGLAARFPEAWVPGPSPKA